MTKQKSITFQLWRECEEHEDLDDEEQWFQQDSAPPQSTNFTMACFSEKFGNITSVAKLKWNGYLIHLNWPHTRFLLLRVPQVLHLQGQPSHCCYNEGSPLWGDSSNHPRWMCMCYQQLSMSQYFQMNGGSLDYVLQGFSWNFGWCLRRIGSRS